jgi:hypothetical protein
MPSRSSNTGKLTPRNLAGATNAAIAVGQATEEPSSPDEIRGNRHPTSWIRQSLS